MFNTRNHKHTTDHYKISHRPWRLQNVDAVVYIRSANH